MKFIKIVLRVQFRSTVYAQEWSILSVQAQQHPISAIIKKEEHKFE